MHCVLKAPYYESTKRNPKQTRRDGGTKGDRGAETDKAFCPMAY